MFWVILLLLAPASGAASGVSPTPLRQGFQNPPDECKPMVRWWWFGPAATHAELEREMRLMKEGGFGGFEIQPVYPLALDDPAKGLINLRYLSKEFLDAVRFTADTARKLGLRMDLTLGSGWPFGGPHVRLAQAASRLRWERVQTGEETTALPMPGARPGERFIAAFAVEGDQESFAPDSLRGLTLVQDRAPRLLLPPDWPRTVLLFFGGRTGQMVKRAALGAEGYVHDHYDRAALETHLRAVGDKLAEAAGPGSIRAVFCDSLEVYGADWTAGLLQHFRKRRGYDLMPYLPALMADIGEKTAPVRHDYGQSLTELFDEQFLTPLLEWCRRQNVLLRVQAYGTPPASLSSYALVDLPEGEGARWNAFSASRWASSAAHSFGRPVASSETWTWIHSPAFRATPLDFKAEADQHFLEGITQLIGHGWPYSPGVAGKPGWHFYAAGVLNQNNPWWHVMPDLTAYLQRVSFMLRQGEPVTDVALYAPTHDAWASLRAGRVSLSEAISERIGRDLIPGMLEAGYNFDLVDDVAINELAKVDKGRLIFGQHWFHIVVLPGVERIPVETMRQLHKFARSGGVVVATRRLPARAPGLLSPGSETGEILRLMRDIFEGPSAPGRFIPEDETNIGRELAKLRRPDVVLSPAARDIGYVHRTSGSAEIYFLANTGNARQSANLSFRAAGGNAEWWNPFTGEVTEAEVLERTKDGTTVAIELEPYGSRLLVFSRPARPGSKRGKKPLLSLPAPLEVGRDWEVTFEDTARRVQMIDLRSWTDDPETRYYSGRARYVKMITVPAEFVQEGIRVKLDFGEPVPVATAPQRGFRAWVDGPVREAAEVFVNGGRAGALWHPPYEIDVSGRLERGENIIEVIVSNLAINRMAGAPLPDYKALIAKYGDRFQPQDMENLRPLPSGLLGPVRLVAER